MEKAIYVNGSTHCRVLCQYKDWAVHLKHLLQTSRETGVEQTVTLRDSMDWGICGGWGVWAEPCLILLGIPADAPNSASHEMMVWKHLDPQSRLLQGGQQDPHSAWH